MSRICGYRCEHNKSGICQISVCDKKSNISDKTEVQTFTRHTDPTITELQQENNKLNGAIQTYDILLKANTEENKKLKDNWNKLKEYIKETKLKEFEKSYGKRYGKTFTQAEIIICNMILDKMQELEQGSDSNE